MTRPVVLFDWDGTLVDNWPVIHDALAVARSSFGLPCWSFGETLRHVSRSGRESFPKMFGENWRRASDMFYAAFEARHLDALSLLPGAEACLDRLEAAGFPLAVVSNKNGVYLRREADRLGWTGRFKALVGAGDACRDKPDAAPVRNGSGRDGGTLAGRGFGHRHPAQRAMPDCVRQSCLMPAVPKSGPGADAPCDSLARDPGPFVFSHRIN